MHRYSTRSWRRVFVWALGIELGSSIRHDSSIAAISIALRDDFVSTCCMIYEDGRDNMLAAPALSVSGWLWLSQLPWLLRCLDALHLAVPKILNLPFRFI